MKITLKQLTIINFKGIKKLVIDFSHVTNIYGENGAGKTSILDAFSWLSWGKDSTDRKDFEVQPLDKNNKLIPKAEVEVSAVFSVDGIESEAKKVLREKWTQKRGSIELEKTGNETTYFWNNVPCKLSEYQAKIDGMIKESLFKLITNTLYFNSMKWQDRRNTLMTIAGNISDYEVAEMDIEFKKLITLLSKKTLEEYKREIAAKKKKSKDELDPIASRIDEVKRGKPEAIDFDAFKSSLQEKLDSLELVENALMDKTQAQDLKLKTVRDKQMDLHTLRTNRQNIENTIRNSFNQSKLDKEREITQHKNEVRTITDAIRTNDQQINAITNHRETAIKEQNELRNKWVAVDAEQVKFNEGEFVCPSCKRSLDASDIDAKKAEIEKNFNADKVARLEKINTRGVELKGHITAMDSKLHELSELNKTLQSNQATLQDTISWKEKELQAHNENSVEAIKKLIAGNVEYQDTTAKITLLEQEIETIVNGSDANSNDSLKQQKLTLQVQIDDIKKQLAKEELIAAADFRIDELATQEKILAQEIADLEATEFLIQQFNKARIDLIQERINDKFKYVTFKMFDTQINGGEVECCDTLINGVPFSDANNAAKINAGLDIINTLCQHHNVYAPIFIDNRESVNQLIQSDSQIINLIVSTDPELRIA